MIWILFAIAVILVAVFIIPPKKETVRASSEVKQKEILSPDALALKERLGLDMSGLNRPITISLTKVMYYVTYFAGYYDNEIFACHRICC